MAQQTNVEEMSSWTENVWLVGGAMLAAGLIIGFLIGSTLEKDRANVGDSNKGVIATSTLPIVPMPLKVYETIEATSSVAVDDQKAGNLVFVKHTEVSKPTWIAVREMLGDNVGNILGAQMITNTSDDVPVTLVRGTVAGKNYAVFLYQDDGNGQFEFKKDPMIDMDGTPVAAMFAAQ